MTIVNVSGMIHPMSKLILKILFFTGVILAIGILAFSLVRYIPPVVSSISTASASLFRTFLPAEKLSIESNKNTVKSGDRFNLSWPLIENTSQDHSLIYVCKPKVNVFYIGGNDTKIPIKCSESFKLGKSGNATLEVDLLEQDTYTDIEFTVIQKTDGSKDRRGTKTITITSGNTSLDSADSNNISSTSTKPVLTSEIKKNPSKNTQTKARTDGGYYVPRSVYTGPADLVISKPIAGYVNPVSGLFFPANQILSSDIGAINFTITNVGGTYSGPWSLSATLPTQEQLFTSVDQVSLAPGTSVLFTLRLGEIERNGNYSIVVVADNRNMVSESNENNNTGETTLSVSGGLSNTGYNSNKADLIIKNLRVTRVSGNDAGITFQIQNIGGKTARNWKFNATLPTRNSDDEDFESDKQPSLAPGDSVEYTLGFDDLRSNGYADLEVDKDDAIDESNERNNSARIRVTN